MGPPWRIDPTTHRTMSDLSLLVLTMSWILLMVFYVVTVTGLLRLGSSSRLSLPCLNSASYFFTMLYEGAFSPSVTTMSAWISLGRKEGRKEIFYLTTHSFIIYGYMASDIIWFLIIWTTSAHMSDISIRRPIASWANALTTELYLTPWNEK